jgi:hypothetical protein
MTEYTLVGCGGHPNSRGRRCGCYAAALPGSCGLPVDQHLLTRDEAEAAGIEGHGRAGCGRLIPRAGLTD